MAQALNVTDESVAHDATYIAGKPKISKMAVLQDHADIEDSESSDDVEVELPEPDEEDDSKMSGSRRIEGLSTEDKSIREGSIYYDIRFVVRVPKDESPIEIIINVEIQKDDTPGYPIIKRGIYYGSRMISAQKGTVFTKQHYEKIQKVVSVWICVGTADVRSDVINVYEIQENSQHGSYTENHDNYDLMRIVVVRLGATGEKSDNPMIRLLGKLFSRTISKEEKIEMLPNEFNIAVTETIDQEVTEMCNLSAGIYDKGIQKGMVTGEKNKAFEIAKSMIQNGLATDLIVKCTGLSVTDVDALKAQVVHI